MRGLLFYLWQFKAYRRLAGGPWTKVVTNLPMSPFWTRGDEFRHCCGSRVIGSENYGLKTDREKTAKRLLRGAK